MNSINLKKVKMMAKSVRLNNGETKRMKPYFTVIGNSEDAMLHFGKYNGQKLTYIYFENSNYIRFLLNCDFPDELKKVIINILKRNDDYEELKTEIKNYDFGTARKKIREGKDRWYKDTSSDDYDGGEGL